MFSFGRGASVNALGVKMCFRGARSTFAFVFDVGVARVGCRATEGRARRSGFFSRKPHKTRTFLSSTTSEKMRKSPMSTTAHAQVATMPVTRLALVRSFSSKVSYSLLIFCPCTTASSPQIVCTSAFQVQATQRILRALQS